MALRIIEAVLLARGIEMASGRLEVRRIALGVLMEMHRVLAGRQVPEIEFHFHARPLRDHGRGADIHAFGVFQFDGFLLYRLGLRNSADSTSRGSHAYDESTKHMLGNHSFGLYHESGAPLNNSRCLFTTERVTADCRA